MEANCDDDYSRCHVSQVLVRTTGRPASQAIDWQDPDPVFPEDVFDEFPVVDLVRCENMAQDTEGHVDFVLRGQEPFYLRPIRKSKVRKYRKLFRAHQSVA